MTFKGGERLWLSVGFILLETASLHGGIFVQTSPSLGGFDKSFWRPCSGTKEEQ
jgi:hypothetical protein